LLVDKLLEIEFINKALLKKYCKCKGYSGLSGIVDN